MELTITDPIFQSNDKTSFLERTLGHLINDPRDLPFLKLILSILVTVFPFAAFLFFTSEIKWWMAVLYVGLTCLYFLGPVVLMLHNTSHRALFKSRYSYLNHFIPWVICPFFGESPETYYAHHIGMHHVESNLKDDISSTLRYQRDSILHFLHYLLSFVFTGIIQLLIYMKKRRRMKLFKKALAGELSFYLLVILLSLINFQATFIVFIMPFIVARIGMMVGNWGQHAFIDASNPKNSFLNSITCINTVYNRRCFNDGYHIGHHLKPSRHWTEMPEDFLRNRDQYLREGAVVFQGLDYFQVWAYLMTKSYSKLASHLVQLGEPRSEAELVAFLRKRTQAIPS